MNLSFLIFDSLGDKPITLVDPIKKTRTEYTVQEMADYLAAYLSDNQDQKDVLQDGDIDAKIQLWWQHKWYVALDYYLCSPTQETNFIVKEKPTNSISKQDSIVLSNQTVKEIFTPTQAVLHRKTYREFKQDTITWDTFSSLLRAIEGEFFPTIYQYYLIVLKVENIVSGVYRYYQTEACLQIIKEGLFREKLTEALCGFYPPLTAAFTFIPAIDIKKAQKMLPYDRALREIYIDVGRICHKLLIKGMQHGIGGVPIAMVDSLIAQILHIDSDKILPIQSITMGLIP